MNLPRLKLLLSALGLSILLLAAAYLILRSMDYELEARPVARSSFVFHSGALDADAGPFAPTPRSAPDAATGSTDGPTEVKNLVVLLADGLGFNHLVAARTALVGARGRLTLETFPVTSWHTTFSANGMYTDSAAGATALATGVLTRPGSLAVDADGNPVPTLMEEAMAAGKSVAVITDSYLWDASPSAWLVHQADRRQYDDIARQMAASGVTMAFGEARQDGPEALEARLQPFRDADFEVLTGPENLEGPSDGMKARVAALPPGSIADSNVFPELKDLVDLALRRLTSGDDGFVLFVESEEIDSGAHNGDLDRVIRGVGSLDAAARRVADFVRDRDDTLVIFTADHETGGLALANSRADEELVPMWAWGYHTGAPVPLLAWGAGAEHLVGVHDNAEVGRILRELMSP